MSNKLLPEIELISSRDFKPDDITLTLFKNWEELFDMDRKDVEEFQMEALRRRFDALRGSIPVLDRVASEAGVHKIGSFEEAVALLFQHHQYKSYPLSFLENGRFDMLTKWLSTLTSIDLSDVDTSECDGIDSWLQALEDQTPLEPFHTSGTTGKLSFFPRTALERDLWMLGFLKIFNGYKDEPGIRLGFDGVRIPVIYPSVRYGRFTTQRLVKFLAEHVAPDPQHCYTMSDGTLSADLMSLSGRIRVAQAKGELDRITLSDSMRIALKRYLDEIDRRPQETDAFMQRMMNELKGKRVLVFSQTSYLVQAAQEGLERGIRGAFATDSVGAIGGGGKGLVLPDGWENMITDFTGISDWRHQYGMAEMTGTMPRCPEGYYHAAPYHIPFVLDVQSGTMLPRSGTQTGRFAFIDLLTQTFWGGLVTGDKVTVEWDRECPCGRKTLHIHDTITRYEESVTGDDKVTCSATVDNTDAALQVLLAV